MVKTPFTFMTLMIPQTFLLNVSLSDIKRHALSNQSTNEQKAVVVTSKDNRQAIGKSTNPQRLCTLYKIERI